MSRSALSVEAFTTLLDTYMPQVSKSGIRVAGMGPGTCTLRVEPNEDMVRAGGTLSGPSMFALADLALYGAVLSRIGMVPLAVTSQMSINFLRKPPVKAMVAEARLLRLGKRSAYGEILIFSEGEEDPVAHATGSYAIPSDRQG